MSRTVSATEARRHLGELMTYVVESNELVIAQRRGIPKVAIVSVERYSEFERRQETQGAIHWENVEDSRQ